MAQIQFSLIKKRLDDWTSKTLTTPTPQPLLRPITSHFCLTPPRPPPPVKVDAINVSHLQRRQTFLPTILLKVTLLHGCFSHGAKRHKVDIPQNKGKSRPSLEYYDYIKKGHPKHSQKLLVLLKTQYMIIILSIISIECQLSETILKVRRILIRYSQKLSTNLKKNEDFKIPVATLRNVGYFRSVFEN